MATPDRKATTKRDDVRSSSIQILHSSDGVVLAGVGRLCVAVWRKKSTRERFLAQKECLGQVVRRYEDGGGYLMVLETTSDPPDDEIRRDSAAMVTELGEKLKYVACVIEGSGFRAAILRTVLSGIVLLIRTSATIRVFDTVNAAAVWVCSCLNLPGPQLLVSQVGIIRTQLDLEAPRLDIATRLKEAGSNRRMF